MKFYKSLVVFAVLTAASIISAIQLSGPKQTANAIVADETYQIRFKTGEVIPEPSKLRAISTDSEHILIQFEQEFTEEVLRALEALGITVIADVTRNTILVYVPGKVDLNTIPGIRWIGKVPSATKISPLLTDRTLLRSLGMQYILLDFHSDVESQVCRDIIQDAGGTILERDALPPYVFLVYGSAATIQELSEYDEVSYMTPAGQALIHNEIVHYCPGGFSEIGFLPRFVDPTNDGWDGAGLGSYALTYNFTNGTADVSGTDENADVIAGIVEWSNVVDVTFAATGTPDAVDSFQILWATGNHSGTSGYDESGSPFDGLSGVLAHAYFPGGSDLSGDMHFDDAEDWSDGASNSFDLFNVSIHEAGHALGLNHSDDPNAVMFPTSSIVDRLQSDDIVRIQLLYAKPSALALYTPNGGESFLVGQTIEVFWVPGDSAGATVSIQLYKSGVFQGYIETSTDNDGFYDWSIPAGLTTSANYSIRVESTSSSSFFDDTDSSFTIFEPTDTTFASTDVPDQIPDNEEGENFGAFSSITIPAGFSGFIGLKLTDIGIDFHDLGDLQFFLRNPNLDFETIDSSSVCSGTAITASARFGFDNDAATSFGSTCPPAHNTDYRPTKSLYAPQAGTDPQGTWKFVVADSNSDTDSAGSLVSWSLILQMPVADPGQFTPVSVDLNAASPGAGTSGAPFSIVEPALSAVTSAGEVQIEPGTYTTGAITIDQIVTLTNNDGLSGVVTIN